MQNSVIWLLLCASVSYAQLVSSPAANFAASSTVTSTQAVIVYAPTSANPCSLQVADMQRGITVVSSSVSGGGPYIVTLNTNGYHGLLVGAVIYLENSGAGGWDGWQTITGITPTSLSFSAAVNGSASGGNVGVLVDDVNPALFANANLDSRNGNIQNDGLGNRNFVVGARAAQIALDGKRYSRALQAAARHKYTLTCDSNTLTQEFTTANPPLGNNYNETIPSDPLNPGQYAYPSIQWSNLAQTLIDPLSGTRMKRLTGPTPTASKPASFSTAVDAQSAWTNAHGPLTTRGGTALFPGPCAAGADLCTLLLRADDLSIGGGATYAVPSGSYTQSAGASLDWVQASFEASMSGGCAGEDCKVQACLTVSGVSCSSPVKESALTARTQKITFGSGWSMDLWQCSSDPCSNPPFSAADASQSKGMASYNASTGQLTWQSGTYFNLRWTTGSCVTFNGSSYAIASLQNEATITLANPNTCSTAALPSGNVTANFAGNNFGVLIWKKTQSTNTLVIGHATYTYGSTPMPGWGAAAVNNCGQTVTVNNVPGDDCFIGNELYWIGSDGSFVDLGRPEYSWYPPNHYFSQGLSAAPSSTNGNAFDPTDGDTYYSLYANLGGAGKMALLRIKYMGNHASNTSPLFDCSAPGVRQPCMQVTVLTPPPYNVDAAAPTFNPNASYSPMYWYMSGVGPDNTVAIYSRAGGQDTQGYLYIYTLGDGTPAGTDATSVQVIAATSTYNHAPFSWCGIHSVGSPDGSGWIQFSGNPFPWTENEQSSGYPVTMTNAPLNQTPNASGGLINCPTNPFGVTGQVCTAIADTGEPSFQNLQVGDLLVDCDGSNCSEYVRVVAITDSTDFIVQRGYVSKILNHTGTTLQTSCGTQNATVGNSGARWGLWNYANDPMGMLAATNDKTALGTHNYVGGGLNIEAGYIFRRGNVDTFQMNPQATTPASAAFDGVMGNTYGVQSHPGTCVVTAAGLQFCLDGRPMLGNDYSGDPSLISNTNRQYTLVSGQLWKFANAGAVLHRKIVPTFASVGRFPLVDVSGPSSTIGTGSADSWKYCYANAAGECYSGSNAGDLYVNAPYVRYPYCAYLGGDNGAQVDDSTEICIGDASATMQSVVQVLPMQDSIGQYTRRLGAMLSRWNQAFAYWNNDVLPGGTTGVTYGRWLEGSRTDDLIYSIPPMPVSDGIARNTFQPYTVNVSAPAGLGVASAVIDFGYAENGGQFYCTSRQENCSTGANSINASAPFYFSSETFNPAPCANTCSIAVPAITQHVLYYRVRFLDANGATVSTTSAQAAAIP